jgi:hypothetical protein
VKEREGTNGAAMPHETGRSEQLLCHRCCSAKIHVLVEIFLVFHPVKKQYEGYH